MFDDVPARVWLLITCAALAVAPAGYVVRYIVHSPRYHDITQPASDLEWRTRRRLFQCLSLLAALAALSLFIFTPAAERFVRSPSVWPLLWLAIALSALFSVANGLVRGRIKPMVRGISAIYLRSEQPKRYWLSMAWNGSIGLLILWAVYAYPPVLTADEERCYDSERKYAPSETLAACENLLSEGPVSDLERSHLLSRRGTAKLEMGRYQAALEDYNRSLSIHPNEPDTLFNRALAFGQLNNPDGAISDYSAFIKLQPGDVDGYKNRGLTYLDHGKLKNAISDFMSAQKLAPNDLSILANRGLAHAWRGDAAMAGEDFDVVRRRDPENVVMLHGEAVLAMNEGRFPSAINALTRAITRDPQDAWAFEFRSYAYDKMGETHKARMDQATARRLRNETERTTPGQR